MRQEALRRLVEQARKDPEFFHSLIFKSKEAVAQADYLPESMKASILELNPEDVIAGLTGMRGGSIGASGCGPVTCACTNACTGDTGSGSSCELSCALTCENTCAVGIEGQQFPLLGS